MNTHDPRVVKTLRHIDEALLASVEARPFREITIAMLCEHALINKTTFYKYYTDKYDCLNRYLDRLLADFREQLHVDFVLASPEKIDDPVYQESFSRVLDFMHRHKREYMILWHAEIERQFYNEMSDTLYDVILRTASGGKSFSPRELAHLELYSHLFAVHTMALFHWWFDHDDTVAAGDVLKLMTGNMTYGLFKTFKHHG